MTLVKRADSGIKKKSCRVRFEDPEEFIADCCLMSDKVLENCFEGERSDPESDSNGEFSVER